MDPPRWLADEMLGRLARYLRFVGCDTLYVRGLSDEAVIERAVQEGRVILTRDRELSRRSPSALLLASPILEEQWRAVRLAYPSVPTEVSFVRCTLCNGPLRTRAPAGYAGVAVLPEPVRAGREPLYVCSACGQGYWEGSHTRQIRDRLVAWEAAGPR